MNSVFIGHDFFGAGNFGDDLMLDGFLRSLDDFDARGAVVACIPHDIESQRRRFPAIQWLESSDPQQRERALQDCDVWLGLGDTPFQLTSGPWSLDHLDRERELCLRLGKPMVFLGVGCEGPETVQDPRARRVIQAAERIWTRDQRSAEAIALVAEPGVVEAGADLAHIALGAAHRPALEPDVLGLLLAFETAGTVEMQAVERLLSRRAAGGTRWMIQEARSFPFSERWNFSRLSEGAQHSLDLMAMDYSTDTLEEFLAHFGAPGTVLSTRYHGALIAAWHGCRVGVIARSEKLAGIASDFDVPCLERVCESWQLAILMWEAVAVETSRLHAQRDRAMAMCRSFLSWLGAGRANSAQHTQ